METPNFSVKWLQAHVTRSLQDQFVQNWQAEVQQKDICILYKSFKTDFKFENYLINLTKQQSLAICKFRTSNHRLPTELGRHTNIHVPRTQRYCNLCNINQMGDEVHVLLECPSNVIVQLRKRYLPTFYQSRPSVFKFVSLMESLSGNTSFAGKVSRLWQSISKLI